MWWIIGYVLSLIYTYLGFRASLKHSKQDATAMYFICMFIPFFNVVWGTVGFWEVLYERFKGKKLLNKFSRL